MINMKVQIILLILNMHFTNYHFLQNMTNNVDKNQYKIGIALCEVREECKVIMEFKKQ